MKLVAVKMLIGVNVAVFLLQSLAPGAFESYFALWPLQPVEGEVYFRFWQVVTYAFLHGGVPHILFNMWGLWLFGSEIERYLGSTRLLSIYGASVVTAAASQLFVPMLFNAEAAPTVGASGGVFGLLLAYAFLFPHRKIVLLFPPIPMPAWLFAAVYAGLELFLGLTGAQSNVAHFAHLGGMIGSGLLLAFWGRRYSDSL
jgi:membrane associated rhomboid family serine protease